MSSPVVKNKNNSKSQSFSNQHVNQTKQNNNVNKFTKSNSLLTLLPNSVNNNDWTAKTSKRTHSNSSYTFSEPPSSPQERQHVNKKIFSLRNRFEVFSSMEQSPNQSAKVVQNAVLNPVINVTPKPTIPHHIFIRGEVDFTGLCTELIEPIGVDNFHCKSTTDRLKIQTTNPESYRGLVHFLRKENAEFHTYQLQENKPTRVVIRNLHPTTPSDLIKEELVMRFFEVRAVSPVLHRLNKHTLPLFFVNLEPTSHSNKIFQLTSLLHTKIKVEEPV